MQRVINSLCINYAAVFHYASIKHCSYSVIKLLHYLRIGLYISLA